MSDNLFQALNFDDLLFLLKQASNSCVVLTLVLVNTDDKIKSLLRKYIKKKSLEFPNVMFLYYAVRDSDFSRGISYLDNKEKFPKMLHIRNFTELLIELETINDLELVNTSFEKLKELYNSYDKENTQDSKQDSKQDSRQDSKPDPELEQKRFIEKLNILSEKTRTFTVEFLEDCMNRKKEEEKEERKKIKHEKQLKK
jgi:hypothetical protein